MDVEEQVFSDSNHTINLRFEWPGYDGWVTQIRAVNYQENPKSITRGKLAKEIAKQLEKFIERMQSTPIDPSFAEYRVGEGGIGLNHINICSLEQVTHGSWQPSFIYNGR